MKKLIALLIGIAFVAGLSGSVLAQGTTTAPKEGTKMDKPAEKPAGEMKKPAAHNANGTVKTAAGPIGAEPRLGVPSAERAMPS